MLGLGRLEMSCDYSLFQRLGDDAGGWLLPTFCVREPLAEQPRLTQRSFPQTHGQQQEGAYAADPLLL